MFVNEVSFSKVFIQSFNFFKKTPYGEKNIGFKTKYFESIDIRVEYKTLKEVIYEDYDFLSSIDKKTAKKYLVLLKLLLENDPVKFKEFVLKFHKWLKQLKESQKNAIYLSSEINSLMKKYFF